MNGFPRAHFELVGLARYQFLGPSTTDEASASLLMLQPYCYCDTTMAITRPIRSLLARGLAAALALGAAGCSVYPSAPARHCLRHRRAADLQGPLHPLPRQQSRRGVHEQRGLPRGRRRRSGEGGRPPISPCSAPATRSTAVFRSATARPAIPCRSRRTFTAPRTTACGCRSRRLGRSMNGSSTSSTPGPRRSRSRSARDRRIRIQRSSVPTRGTERSVPTSMRSGSGSHDRLGACRRFPPTCGWPTRRRSSSSSWDARPPAARSWPRPQG